MTTNDTRSTGARVGGTSILGLLTIAFVVLKLTGVIAWSWWWVLAPLWIPTAIVVVFLLIALVVFLVKR
jgi:hypothetical protein